jgi:AcrR family transcriptional regulator
MEPRRRQERSDGRRAAILGAALEAFQEVGFAQATMEDIRRRSGASTGSIYHHFTSKEGLAAALYLDGLDDYQSSLTAELHRHRDAERGIRAIVHHHLDWVAAHPELARYLLEMGQAESIAHAAAEARALRQAFFQRVFAWIRPRSERGELRPLPEPVLVALVIGPSQEYGRYWLGHRDEPERRRARRLLADAAWNAVRGEDAHGRA